MEGKPKANLTFKHFNEKEWKTARIFLIATRLEHPRALLLSYLRALGFEFSLCYFDLLTLKYYRTRGPMIDFI